ncbi:MAG: UbiA family prenyltransferase [Candidatus Zixiibacteriota bacterium]|nr:MAG: UbiA family prenyltransferase [candidate division Zixibacteria bacterium]
MLHLPLWSIYLVSLHYHLKLSGESFQWQDLVILAGTTLLAAAAYYINQVYDVGTDRVNRKLGFLQGNFVSVGGLTALYIALSVAAVAVVAMLSPVTLGIFLAAFVLGYFYSTPPLKLKDRPVAGLVVNAVGIGFMVPVLVMPDASVHNIGLLGWDNPLYFMLAVGSIYLLTTLPDREGDAAAGKRTAAVVLPRMFVLLGALILILLAAYTARRSGHELLSYLALASSALILVNLMLRKAALELAAAKIPILLLTALAGYFFPLYLLIIVAIIFAGRIYYKKRFGVIYPRLA